MRSRLGGRSVDLLRCVRSLRLEVFFGFRQRFSKTVELLLQPGFGFRTGFGRMSIGFRSGVGRVPIGFRYGFVKVSLGFRRDFGRVSLGFR